MKFLSPNFGRWGGWVNKVLNVYKAAPLFTCDRQCFVFSSRMGGSFKGKLEVIWLIQLIFQCKAVGFAFTL